MRAGRHQHRTQGLRALLVAPPVVVIGDLQRGALRLGEVVKLVALARALQPAAEAGQRRQRDEGPQRGDFLLQIGGHLLDEEVAERDARQPLLAVGDGIEHRRRWLARVVHLAFFGQKLLNRAGDALAQRDLHEDQRLIDQRWVEKGVAAPVARIEPAAQIAPVLDLVHRLIADDLLQNVRRRRPVDALEHEKAAVEPRVEQRAEIRVHGLQLGMLLREVEQVGAHGDDLGGRARRHVQPAQELLHRRFDAARQLLQRGLARRVQILLGGFAHALRIGRERLIEELEERQPLLAGKRRIGVEDAPRQRHAGRLAPRGHQRA